MLENNVRKLNSDSEIYVERNQAPADGKWHDIIKGLDSCTAYEIVAKVSKEKHGRHALIHAFAISTFGKSRNKIRTTQGYYGGFWNKMKLRYVGSTYNYKIQIRTGSNYGDDIYIKYYIRELWNDEMF